MVHESEGSQYQPWCAGRDLRGRSFDDRWTSLADLVQRHRTACFFDVRPEWYISTRLQPEGSFRPGVGHLTYGNCTPRHIYEAVSEE